MTRTSDGQRPSPLPRAASSFQEPARPLRDRAIIYPLFGTGLRRAELVGLDLDQLEPAEVDGLRQAKKARLTEVRGKGRAVFVGRDARHALADYLEHERPGDAAASTGPAALLLSAASIGARRPDGRLSPRSINTVVAEIGRLHDAQTPDRKLGTLRPHDARHAFAFQLSQASGHKRAELERRATSLEIFALLQLPPLKGLQ
ncbi:tyrosine-type recombinase/integrase [Nonomuraea sp. PA05]|uniref:tyrosine-type recombinase/integrase n=1 Tax=Nonomuraea sp. PA05 TaxID=2604466 RepID=UPI0011D30838|nr:tyrosine-type recombinase/integrase [Nonomuraea sp. PA05]TYB62164.1 tyrosine-type recombinase/integrase [Nonomuraea sp. PA05]